MLQAACCSGVTAFAIIISGAPAVTGIDDKINAIDDRVFLRAMIAAGVDEVVDAIGVYPYGGGNPPDERAADATQLRSGYDNHPILAPDPLKA